jgi:hypothetical protein
MEISSARTVPQVLVEAGRDAAISAASNLALKLAD